MSLVDALLDGIWSASDADVDRMLRGMGVVAPQELDPEEKRRIAARRVVKDAETSRIERLCERAKKSMRAA